jgi:hypothetical protein
LKLLSAIIPALALVAVVGSAAATGACIADPPPATTCPPPEPSASDCSSALASLTQPEGCAPSVYQQCLGATCGVECPATACAPNPAACWPNGECPPALLAQTSASTSCLRLDAELAPTCNCGCPRCVSECDGHGVPLAAFVPPPPPGSTPSPVPFFQFRLPAKLPTQGRMGLYVRLRGQLSGGAMVLGIAHGTQPVNAFPITSVEPAYSDMMFGIGDAGQLTGWSSTDAAPDSIVVLLLPTTKVAVEIDCIVPFVEPL